MIAKNQPTGGIMSLEDMKLDNTDADVSNFDPFYNPLTSGQGAGNGETITLKEQNYYMGVDTGTKQQFWSPEQNNPKP